MGTAEMKCKLTEWFWRDCGRELQDRAVPIPTIALQRTKMGRVEKSSLNLLIGVESKGEWEAKKKKNWKH